MTLSRELRTQLIAAMREAGPLAQTACSGWRVQDLAAHLWVREHRLRALPGIGCPRFAGPTARLQQEALHGLGFEALLEDLRRPAGVLRVLDKVVNPAEYYIHLEDVLRPQGRRAALTPQQAQVLRIPMLLLAKRTQRSTGVRLVVTPAGGHSRNLGSGQQVVYVEGPTQELLLHFSGRESDVLVTAEDPEKYLANVKGL